MESLQARYAPESICFGCGPKNPKGLRIDSYVEGDELVADWTPEPQHQAFEGIVNGGIIGALLDCHSNWTAAWHLITRDHLETLPTTVTADFHVTLLRPTPADRPVRLRARVAESKGTRVLVDATLESDGRKTATCRGTFVAVQQGHPAFGRR